MNVNLNKYYQGQAVDLQLALFLLEEKFMSVFRVDKRRDFTVIANHVFKDTKLSAKAKGILVEMLSLPENWDYTLKGLATLFSDGIDSIRQGIRELEEHGYVVHERRRDAKGRLEWMEYVIYETPHAAVENISEVSVPVFSGYVQNFL